jgi:integrase
LGAAGSSGSRNAGGLVSPDAETASVLRYLQQFEPQTEIPEDAIFGPEPKRVAPHIYREEEIVALLDAAAHLGPPGSLRPATYEALFGLMAATGLRVSEAIHLQERDVDLARGVLTVRVTCRSATSTSLAAC